MAEQPARTVTLTDEIRKQLNAVSTATIVSQLQRRGIRSTFFTGLKPLNEGQRILGYAHTLRYVPMREDIAKTAGLNNAQRQAVESVTEDEVLVIECREEHGAGTIGDIFTMRAKFLGGVAVITDGALRDTPAIKRIGLPVYHGASHAATLQRLHMPLDHNIPISCAGVTVFPNDIIVGDEEGACVIPAALVAEVAADSYTMEIEEEWALERVAEGDSSIGTFPIAPDRRAEFEAWLAKRNG